MKLISTMPFRGPSVPFSNHSAKSERNDEDPIQQKPFWEQAYRSLINAQKRRPSRPVVPLRISTTFVNFGNVGYEGQIEFSGERSVIFRNEGDQPLTITLSGRAELRYLGGGNNMVYTIGSIPFRERAGIQCFPAVVTIPPHEYRGVRLTLSSYDAGRLNGNYLLRGNITVTVHGAYFQTIRAQARLHQPQRR